MPPTKPCFLCQTMAAELERLEAIHKIKLGRLEDGEKAGENEYYRLKLAEVEAKLDCARAMLALHEHQQGHGALAEPA